MKIKLILFFILMPAYCMAQTTTPDSAKYFEGSLKTVCGKVFPSFSKSGNTYLNFEKPFPNNEFSAVIFAKDTLKFKEYQPAKYFADKNVCVTGIIKMYKEKAEIIIMSPDQIHFAD